jgi:excisionase family DNA binding protein
MPSAAVIHSNRPLQHATGQAILVKKLVTPKQVAQAINVSESSLKRWCDQGLLTAIRTAGGHRRLALAAALNTSLRIYHPARSWMRYNCDFFDHPYQPRFAQKIVGLAFLNVVAAWDEIVEHLFLGYMAGRQNRLGYAPELLLGPSRAIDC